MHPSFPLDPLAHAQSDALSFVLSVEGRRVVIDPGTATHAAGPQRSWERSTAAHSTVEGPA